MVIRCDKTGSVRADGNENDWDLALVSWHRSHRNPIAVRTLGQFPKHES